MRTPRRHRPKKRVVVTPAQADLRSVSERVFYVGSPKHKDRPSYAGPPRARRGATLCPPELDRETVTAWLRSAVRHGTVGGRWDGAFPRYVWHEDGGTVYEGRLVNQGNGSYKGWPLKPSERPDGM